MISPRAPGAVANVPLLADVLREVDAAHPNLEPARRAHELVRRVITRMIDDVIAESGRRLAALAPASVADIRGAGAPVVAFSPAMVEADRAIKSFLLPRMYQHARITSIMAAAEGVLRDLFDSYTARPQDLPTEWRSGLAGEPSARARHIADFIAGMTDRFALIEHARLFDSTPELR